MNFHPYSTYTYSPILAKFGTRGLHVMLRNVCEYRENPRRKGRTACTAGLYTALAKSVAFTPLELFRHATGTNYGNYSQYCQL
jgi:hypothetical protein